MFVVGDESKLHSVRQVGGRLRLGVRVTTKRYVVVRKCQGGCGDAARKRAEWEGEHMR